MTQPRPSVTEIDRFLHDCHTYPERPRDVTRIETHISTVYLTNRFAYKLKKPVRFDFLDYSTPATRRRACEDEVRLNRRLAPDVYPMPVQNLWSANSANSSQSLLAFSNCTSIRPRALRRKSTWC